MRAQYDASSSTHARRRSRCMTIPRPLHQDRDIRGSALPGDLRARRRVHRLLRAERRTRDRRADRQHYRVPLPRRALDQTFRVGAPGHYASLITELQVAIDRRKRTAACHHAGRETDHRPPGRSRPGGLAFDQASGSPTATLPNHSSMVSKPPALAALPWSCLGRSSWIRSMRFQPASGVSHCARGT